MSKIKNDLTVAYQIPGNNRKMDSPAVIVISQKMAEDGMAKRRRSFLAFWAIFVCFYGLSFLIGFEEESSQFYNELKFIPCKTSETYRLVSYGIVHSNKMHLAHNALLHLISATNLLWAAVNPEMELIKICITFTLAIAFAAPISSLVTGSSLVGSSAGVLALMAANLPLETPKISRTVFAVKSVIVFVAIGQLLLEGFGFAAERASTESHLTGVIVGILMCLLFDEETISFWAKVLMWILILATLIALIILLSTQISRC